MRRKRHPGKDKESGQAIVEFAIVLPLLLILLFGVIDFGRALQTYITINNASREGARLGAINPEADIEGKVRDAAGAFDNDSLTVAVDFPDGEASGESVVVDVDYEYSFITPLGSFVESLAGTLTLGTSSDMRIE
ncbi:MAG TPA: TadE family protein [Dehalococcoidia bacterium]|nr:TadE family protein [Dehalococcoidia bacterium]